MNRLLAWMEQAMKRWDACPMMTDTARQQAALLLAHRLESATGQVLQALCCSKTECIRRFVR